MCIRDRIKAMITQYNHGVEPKFLSAVEELVQRLIVLVSMFASYNETAYCFGAVYSYETKAILLKIWEELQAYLPEGMLPDFTQIPPIKMALEMMGGQMPQLPAMPKKEDLHPLLQASYDALF